MIQTNYEQLYIKGEKSGSETITLASSKSISVSIEVYTENLNGSVDYVIENNNTSNVSITYNYSNLYLNGETYSANITAISNDEVLNIPVIINCSDTLIYTDVRDTIDVLDGIHINYNSLPYVNKVNIVLGNGDKIDMTPYLYNQSINLTYNELLTKFGFINYNYLIADNGMSMIAHKLRGVNYTLESISSLTRYIDYKKQDVILHFKSLINNIPFEPIVNVIGDIDYKMVLVDKEYFLYLSINENSDDEDRIFSVNVIQPESYYTLEYTIVQYKYGKDISGIEWGEYEKYDYVVRYSGDGWKRLIPQRSANWGLLVYPSPNQIIYNNEDIKSLCEIENSGGSGSTYYDYYFEEKNPIIAFDFGPNPPYDNDEYPSCSHGLFAGASIETIHRFKINPKYDDYSYMFRDCTSLENIEGLMNWDTSNVTNMSNMFAWCNLSNLSYLKDWDVSNVTDMSNMFAGNINLVGCSYIGNWDTSNVTDMSSMFADTPLYIAPKLNTINVKNIGYMFRGCNNIEMAPLYDCGNIESTYQMFYDYYHRRYCERLMDLGGFKNLKVDLDLSGCNRLTHQSLMNVINNLAEVATSPTLSLGTTNLAKLTDDEKLIAINKGWILA